MGDWRTKEGNPIADILTHVIRTQPERPFTLLMSPQVVRILLDNPDIIDQFGEDVTLDMVNEELAKSGVRILQHG